MVLTEDPEKAHERPVKSRNVTSLRCSPQISQQLYSSSEGTCERYSPLKCAGYRAGRDLRVKVITERLEEREARGVRGKWLFGAHVTTCSDLTARQSLLLILFMHFCVRRLKPGSTAVCLMSWRNSNVFYLHVTCCCWCRDLDQLLRKGPHDSVWHSNIIIRFLWVRVRSSKSSSCKNCLSINPGCIVLLQRY